MFCGVFKLLKNSNKGCQKNGAKNRFKNITIFER